MSRDDGYLLDILNSARLALEYVAEISRDEFLHDFECQDAVIRRIGIIGEAARRLSPARRAQLSHIPWSAIIGMRNIVVHEYDRVNLDRVWGTVNNDLPPLIAVLQSEVPAEEA